MKTAAVTPNDALPRVNMLRRFGTAAFLFFLVKGLAWIAAPFVFLFFA